MDAVRESFEHRSTLKIGVFKDSHIQTLAYLRTRSFPLFIEAYKNDQISLTRQLN